MNVGGFRFRLDVFQVRHELAGKVFSCCSFIIKHDYKVTIYLLPHILLYMLLGCTPEEQQEVSVQASLEPLIRFSLSYLSPVTKFAIQHQE